jgi:hypothetical protein
MTGAGNGDPAGEPTMATHEPADRDLSPLLARMPTACADDAAFDASITALYTRQEVDWDALGDALERWRPTLEVVADRVRELEPGSLRVPERFIRRTWRLLDVFQCEAHWQAQHGDRARPLAILTTLLKLCRLLERPPSGDARLTRLHAALLTRSMVLTSFRDPRLFLDAPATAVGLGAAMLAELEPDLPAFRAAMLGEASHYVAFMGGELFQRRGRPFEVSGGRSIPIPESPAERGLWLECAREHIHETMLAGVRGFCEDHGRSLRSLRSLVARSGAAVAPPSPQAARAFDRLSVTARANLFVAEAVHESALLLAHTHRIWLHNVQGHRILGGMLAIERFRQEHGQWPSSLGSARRALGVSFADPLTGTDLRYERDEFLYRLDIPATSAALLAAR